MSFGSLFPWRFQRTFICTNFKTVCAKISLKKKTISSVPLKSVSRPHLGLLPWQFHGHLRPLSPVVFGLWDNCDPGDAGKSQLVSAMSLWPPKSSTPAARGQGEARPSRRWVTPPALQSADCSVMSALWAPEKWERPRCGGCSWSPPLAPLWGCSLTLDLNVS